MARISEDLAAKLLAHRERKAARKAAPAKVRAVPVIAAAPMRIESAPVARADWLAMLR